MTNKVVLLSHQDMKKDLEKIIGIKLYPLGNGKGWKKYTAIWMEVEDGKPPALHSWTDYNSYAELLAHYEKHESENLIIDVIEGSKYES